MIEYYPHPGLIGASLCPARFRMQYNILALASLPSCKASQMAIAMLYNIHMAYLQYEGLAV